MEDVPQPHNYTRPQSRVRKKKVLNYVMNCAEIQKIVHILNFILTIKYGFCKKSPRKNVTLTSRKLYSQKRYLYSIQLPF